MLCQEDALQGAMNELVSAMSALNMYPDPIKDAEGYLSETDGWAKHSMEHMRAVFTLLQRAHSEHEKLKTQLFKARVQIAAARSL